MKAINKCEWVVQIAYWYESPKCYRWHVLNLDGIYLGDNRDKGFTSRASAKRNFLKFAKVNGIKKWRFV